MSTISEDLERWPRGPTDDAGSSTAHASGKRAIHDPYDPLLAGLEQGRFGGIPLGGSPAHALIEALRRNSWRIDYRAFSGAIPHFPTEFGLEDVRGSLRHLGFESSMHDVRGRNLTSLPAGSFVLHGTNDFLFIDSDAAGRGQLFNPVDGSCQKIRKRLKYHVVVLQPAEVDAGTKRKRNSWVAKQILRFAPENNVLFLLTFLSNMLVIVASLSVSFIFDKVLPAEAHDTLIAIMVGVVMLLATDLKLRSLKAQIIARVSGRLEFIISNSLLEKLLSFRLEMLTAASVSDQLNRLKQFETIRDYFAGPIVAVIFELPFVIVMLLVVFYLNSTIGLVLLGAICGYAALGFIIYPKIVRTSGKMATLRAECLRLQEETISQRQQILERGLGQVWADRLIAPFDNLGMARQDMDNVWRLLNSLITVASPLAMGAVIFSGALQVIAGNMTGGGLIACMILSTRLLGPVQQALILAVRAPEFINMLRQVDAMMKLPGEDKWSAKTSHAALRRIDTAPRIALDNVILRYPRSVAPALRGVAVQIDGGSFVCITGPSGAGKSSFLRAVMGHYEAQHGTILIGSSNINQLSATEKTQLIGHLGHESLQIHGTIAQNLRLTAPEATMEHIRSICEELGVLASIEALPKGFETRMDQQSRHRYSPAFRTKLALAQLLIKSPRVLLMDEPEAGLSNDDENRLMTAVRRRRGQTTCIMITHRPSLIRQADKVIVLQAGQIAFQGSVADFERGRAA